MRRVDPGCRIDAESRSSETGRPTGSRQPRGTLRPMPDAVRAPIPMLDLASEVDGLWSELQPAVERVLLSVQVIGGPEVDALEAGVAAFPGCGTRWA